MSLRFTGTLVLSFVCLAAPSVASAQVQTFTATHTYNAWAQAFLGLLYAEGHGVPKNYVKARQWYEKAAAQGDADAQDHMFHSEQL